MRISDWSSDVCSSDLLAVGMTFVILTGGIDLSVGSVVAMSTMILAKTLEMGWSLPVAAVTVLLVATLLGTVLGVLTHYFDRSDERRVWQECVRPCSSRWSPYNYTQKLTTTNKH